MKNPCITDYEWELSQPKVLHQPVITTEELDKFNSLFSIIQLKSDDDVSDEWVTNIEQLLPLIKNSLMSIEDKPGKLVCCVAF